MGYLSTAALAVHEHTYYDMVRQAEAEGNEEAYRFLTVYASDLLRVIADPGKDNIVIVIWDGVKWYKEFDDIRFVEKWMNAADTGQVSYSFTRFGEDYDDVEDRYSEDCELSGYVWISRTIITPSDARQFEPCLRKGQDEAPSAADEAPAAADEAPATTDEELMDYLEQ